ncbi:hypothetical protein lh_264 [Escherichia phage LH01]
MSHNLQNVVEAEREREALVYNELLVPFLALHSYEQEDYIDYVKSVEKPFTINTDNGTISISTKWNE